MKYECAVCDIEFPSLEQFDEHRRARHGPPPGPQPGAFACRPCNATFTTEAKLQEHIQARHAM